MLGRQVGPAGQQQWSHWPIGSMNSGSHAVWLSDWLMPAVSTVSCMATTPCSSRSMERQRGAEKSLDDALASKESRREGGLFPTSDSKTCGRSINR